MEVMCGRFAVTTDPAKLAEKIKAIDEATGKDADAAGPSYDVAPTATVATVVSRDNEPDAARSTSESLSSLTFIDRPPCS